MGDIMIKHIWMICTAVFITGCAHTSLCVRTLGPIQKESQSTYIHYQASIRYLLYQVRHDTRRAEMAWFIFIEHTRSNRLDDSQIRQIADEALKLQTNLNRPWLPFAGMFLEYSRSKKMLPDDLWEKYLANIIKLDVEYKIRPEFVIGQWIPVRLKTQKIRCSNIKVRCNNIRTKVFFDKQIIWQDDGSGGINLGFNRPHISFTQQNLSEAKWRQIQPGQYTCTLVKTFQFNEGRFINHTFQTYFDTPEKKLHEMEIKYTMPITALQKGKETVTPIDDHQYQAAVESAVKIDRLVYHTSTSSLSYSVHLDKSPVNLSFKPVLEFAGKTLELNDIFVEAGCEKNFGGGLTVRDITKDQITTATIRLVPNGFAASQTIDMKDYWGGSTIEFVDLPVKIDERVYK